MDDPDQVICDALLENPQVEVLNEGFLSYEEIEKAARSAVKHALKSDALIRLLTKEITAELKRMA